MISRGRIFKVSKPNNVMHVHLLAELCFGNPALLAGVIIPLTSATTLALPSWAVVHLVISAAPTMVIFAAMPSVSTVGGTKSESSSSLKCSRKGNVLSALFAIVFVYWFFRWLWCYKFAPACFLVTLSGTHSYDFRSYLEWLTVKYSAAYLTGVRIVISLLFAPKFIRAFTTTRCLSAVFQATRISKVGIPAIGASSFNHVHIIA